MFKLTVAQRAGLMLQQVIYQSRVFYTIQNVLKYLVFLFFLIEVVLMCWNRGLRTETTSSS